LGIVILTLIAGASLWPQAQGFLSQLSSGTGGQQGAQNQAAQSSIAIDSASVRNGTVLIVIRNVGAVSVSIGSISLGGLQSNSGFRAEILVATPPSGHVSIVASDGSSWTITPSDGSSYQNIAKGSAFALTLQGPSAFAKPNDVLILKVKTTVGTFAQTQLTVP